MSNIYLNTPNEDPNEKNWIHALVLTDSGFYFRSLAPVEEFRNIQEDYETSSEISKDDLLKSENLLTDSCSFNKKNVLNYFKDSAEFILVYETFLSLDSLKDMGTWHSGALCNIYVPIVSRLYKNKEFLTHAISKCWHQSKAHGESLESTEMIIRRSIRFTNLLQYVVKDEFSNLLNSPVVINVTTGKEFITNFEYEAWDNSKEITDFLPQYELELPNEITTNSLENIIIRAKVFDDYTNLNNTIEIKMLNGYAPKTRVTLQNGIGTFSVKALDLNPGDKVIFQVLDYGRICSENEINVV